MTWADFSDVRIKRASVDRFNKIDITFNEIEGTVGKIKSRKMLTLKDLHIGSLMCDIYLPALGIFIYHIYCVHIFFKEYVHFYFVKILTTLKLKIFLQLDITLK